MFDDIAVIPVERWLISSSPRKTVNKILALESDGYYCKYFSASMVEVSAVHKRILSKVFFARKMVLQRFYNCASFKVMYPQSLTEFNYFVIYIVKESNKSLC